MQVMLITGASRGLGRVLYDYFDNLGRYKVYGTSRQATESGLLSLDVTDASSIRDCVKEIIDCEGRLDILINNAGVNLIGSFEGTSEEEWKRVVEVNTYGPMLMIKTVLPIMRQQKTGRIINVSSVGSWMSLPYNSAYGASKAALSAVSESLYYELIGSDIHLSLIEPIALKIDQETPRIDYVKWECAEHQKQSDEMLNKMLTKVVPYDRRHKVARRIEKILSRKNPNLHYCVSIYGVAIIMMKRLLPQRLFRIIFLRFLKL